MKKSVVIVVLNWNRKNDTIECLESIQKLDYPNFETVVVDNGSTDGSEEAIRETFPSVTVLATQKNLGFAGGNNVGIRHALSRGADYVWLLNNDTIVSPSALSALVETAESDSSIAFVGSKIYFYDRPNVIWFAGGTINLAAGGVTSHAGIGEKDTGQFDRTSDIGYVTGCSLLATKEAISAIGFLPEEYFLYFEETDWNISAQRKGYRTVLAPTSHVWHKNNKAGGNKDRFIYYSLRNRIHLVRKFNSQYTLKAIQVNIILLYRYISATPFRAARLCLIALIAHLDAFRHRDGMTKWRI